MFSPSLHSISINKIKSAKFKTLISCFNDTLTVFKDAIEEYYAMETELDKYKLQLEECKRQPCKSCEDSQKVIASKESLIQSIASLLTKLNDKKDLNLINNIFKLINGDYQSLTPLESNSDENNSTKTEKSSEDITIDDGSSSDIEGTPMGRISPILSKTNRCKENRKKKTDNEWPTPESKIVKQTTPERTPKTNAKMKQLRLKFAKTKASSIADLTMLTELRRSQNDKSTLQLNTKKGSMENEDTILPSPTSLPKQEFSHIYKSFETVSSPCKLKKPKSKLALKKDRENITPITLEQDTADQSINLLHPISDRLRTSPLDQIRDIDETFCDSFDIGSDVKMNVVEKNIVIISPSKSPLIENINADNLSQDYCESMLLLPQNRALKEKSILSKIIKQEKHEPLYKEATIRKKSEKLALPGWSCEKCKNFYDILYKDNPVMLQKLMTECSKHRGRNNPARPATPPGYWNPRWDVADDTEKFNRENNAI